MKNLTPNEVVALAITDTMALLPDYFRSTCEQRLAGGAGSCYDGITTVEELSRLLPEAEWVETTHPDVMPGCRAFMTTDIPGGKFGLTPLSDLADDAEIIASDPKNTGKVSLTVRGVRGTAVAETYLIVGPENGHDVVYTFHPGAPVRPSLVETSTVPDGTRLTKAEALDLGFELAKIIG